MCIEFPPAPHDVFLLCSRSSWDSPTYKVIHAYADEQACMNHLFSVDPHQFGTHFYIKIKLNYECPF
jgi:tRNA A37 threonylcarbamoyladenosine biosynthesis protein TsaE